MLPTRFQKHETKFALFMAWILCPCLLTLLGFYMGTIFGNREHKIDLQVADIHNGATGALLFFAGSIVAAIVVTAIVPGVVDRDYAQREEKWAHQGDKH